MSKAYKLTLMPEDIETRTAYYEVPDDVEIAEADADDWFDCILSSNPGYYLEEFEECTVDEARAHDADLWTLS